MAKKITKKEFEEFKKERDQIMNEMNTVEEKKMLNGRDLAGGRITFLTLLSESLKKIDRKSYEEKLRNSSGKGSLVNASTLRKGQQDFNDHRRTNELAYCGNGAAREKALSKIVAKVCEMDMNQSKVIEKSSAL